MLVDPKYSHWPGCRHFPARFLDGQQRLTSLYQALLHPDAVSTQDSRGEKRLSWFYIDMRQAVSDAADREDAVITVPNDKKITRDFGRETVLDLSSPEFEYEELMFPTGKLFDPLEWTLNYTRYWGSRASLHPAGDPTEFFSRFNDRVIKPFADYLLPVIHLEKETPKEAVCTVFEKVNTGGVPLNVFELATASFAAESEEFSLRDDWRDRRQRLYPSYGGVQYVKPQLFTDTIYFPKRNAKKQKSAAIKNNTKKRTPPKDPSPERTPLSPEAKKERDRTRSQEKRSKAKAMGLCRDCPQPAIDGQTRCRKHRADLLAYSRSRRAAAKQSENSPSPKPPARTPQNGANPQPAKPTDQPRPQPGNGTAVSSNRQAYEHLRKQHPERREAQRKVHQRKRDKAKQSGNCVNCSNKAIKNQTRCETCAEKHRKSRRRNRENKKAADLTR